MYHQNATALLRLTLSRNTDGTLHQDVEIIPCYVYEDTWQPCRITDPADETQVRGFLSGQSETPTME